MTDKSYLQEQVIKEIAEHKRIALQWATGVGKGYTAVRIIKELKPSKVLIVVAETAHKQNWIEEIFKAGGVDSIFTQITIECYASLKNYRGTHWDLVILDEAHHVGSDMRLDIISTIKSDMILLLSATLEKETLQCLELIFGRFKSMKINIQEAINNGYLPEPKIFLIPLNLDYINKTEIIEDSWGNKSKRIEIKCDFKDRWKYLKNKESFPNVHLIMNCTPYDKYHYLSDNMEYNLKRYMITRKEIFKTKALRYGSQRKVLMGESKTQKALTLLDSLRDKRYICFCASIQQADVLGGTDVIHSKRTDNQSTIDKFNQGEINKLFAVGMAQEGMNLKNIQAGIIIQLDGKERAFIQKFGRVLRAESPVQYIFYYRNTQDEKWLNNVLEGIDKSYIKTL